MPKTIDDYLKEISNDRGEEQYSFATLFNDLTDDAEEAIGGNCVLFSMTERIAKALNGIRNELPQEMSIRIDMPLWLTTGVRHMDRNAAETLGEAVTAENRVIPIGKGALNDSLVDDGYYPDNVFIEIGRNGINIEVSTETVPGDGHLNCKCVAKMPGGKLVNAMEEATNTPPDRLAEFAEQLFGSQSVPAMSPH